MSEFQIQNKIVKVGIAGPGKLGQLAMLLGYESRLAKLPIEIFTISADKPYWSSEHYSYNSPDSIYSLFEDLKKKEVYSRITFESESIDESFTNELDKRFPNTFIPSLKAIRIFKNRINEKDFLSQTLGLDIPEFKEINLNSENVFDYSQLLDLNSKAYILKTAEGGYDGIGQAFVNNANELKSILENTKAEQFILEEKIDIDYEVSVVVTRFGDGKKIYFPPTHNKHKAGILLHSIVIQNISDELKQKLYSQAAKIVDELDYIGTLTVEFFVDRNGKVLINEIAPRVHNSGHITSLCKNNINQFTMHMMAVAEINMSKAEILQNPEYDKSYNSMINILGLSFEQIEEARLIDRSNLLNAEIEEKLTVFEKANWTLYWYGKQPNNSRVRKMGHILISAETQTKGREIEEIIKENILGVLGSDQKALLEIYSSL